MELVAVTPDDLDFLAAFELCPRKERVVERLGDYRLVRDGGSDIGFLCFAVLWGTLPFLEFFELRPELRRAGRGRSVVRCWEVAMAERGFDLVIVSTGADSDAQHFWRKMGYVDCGALMVRSKPAEVFLQKKVIIEADIR